ELRRAVAHVLATCRQEALVEEFVGGREFNVSLLGNGRPTAPHRVLPPGEYLYHSDRWKVCTFEANWDEANPPYGGVEAICRAKLSRHLHDQLERMALACARIFDLCGYARIDIRLNGAGIPQVLDVNPNPDLAPRMGIARSAEVVGMDYSQ